MTTVSLSVGLRRTFYAVLGMVLSRSAVLAGWQRRQGVELGLVQSDVGRGGVGGNLHFSFRADDRRGDRRHRLAPGLAFVCGDAQSMPFPPSSFDAVVNIESSHCYESMETFLSEVRRVLRPGGRLFFADLRSVEGVNTLREQFNACGLILEKETDITTNVLTALQLDNARKLELIDALIPPVFHRPFRVFAGIAGTRNCAGLESGKLRYLSAQLVKSSPAHA